MPPEFLDLDSNASTSIHPEVVEAMLPFLREHHGNPSSSHGPGKITKDAVERARSRVASLLGCRSAEILFTSGGTESNNHALQGTVFTGDAGQAEIVTSSIEHPAIHQVCDWLRNFGVTTKVVPATPDGTIDLEALAETISSSTTLVTVMHANNETGILQPIPEIAKLAHAAGAVMHTDAAQSLGKVPTNVDELGVDLLSIAGHKLYAPKGVGALYVREGTELARFMHGAGHEGGRRAGTEAVHQVVGLGKACELAERELEERMRHFAALRDRLEEKILSAIPGARVHGSREHRLPNTLSLCLPGVDAAGLLERMPRVLASTGSACHAGEANPSPVLTAMGVERSDALGTLRLTVGCFNTEAEMDEAATAIVKAVAAG